MEKLLKAQGLLNEALDLFTKADDSNEMFIRGTIRKAKESVDNRIKAVNDVKAPDGASAKKPKKEK